MGFIVPAGDVIVALRSAKGWTQPDLAEQAGVGFRTVQRAEGGNRVRAERLTRVAAALGVELSQLRRRPIDVLEIADEFTCRHCGARLTDRVSIPNEYGDDELDRFECGAEAGYRDRPCPKDPRFPPFEDYELHTHQEEDRFYTHAQGKTDMARAVELESGWGRTKEAAEKWVQRSYIAKRDGQAAAEKSYSFHEHMSE